MSTLKELTYPEADLCDKAEEIVRSIPPYVGITGDALRTVCRQVIAADRAARPEALCSEPMAWAIFTSDTHEMIDTSLLEPDETPGQYAEPLYTRSPLARIHDGWKLVPIAPSDAMIEAGYESQLEWPDDWSKNGTTPELYQAMAAYGAMLAAAPSVLPSGLARIASEAAAVLDAKDQGWNEALEEAAEFFDGSDTSRFGQTADLREIAKFLRECKRFTAREPQSHADNLTKEK